MGKELDIEEKFSDGTLNLVLDTLALDKQAIVFVNTRRGAESQAEKIAAKIDMDLKKLSDQILNVLSKPTKQCKRLALCVKKGSAFHHSGLHSEQRSLIEDYFRKGVIKFICATPTLCLSADTNIWHGMSETVVSKFKNNKSLYVLSDNRIDNIKAQDIQVLSNSSKLLEIASVSGHSIKVTPNHKMLVQRDGKRVILPAKELRKTDKIATVGRLNISDVHNPKISDFVKDNEFSIFDQEFDEKLSYFIGVMLGDGYSGACFNDGEVEYKGSPSIVGIDKEIFSQAESVCLKPRISYRHSFTYHGTPQLVLGKNKWFREFLVRCGVEKREKKHISKQLISMDLKNTAALLSGLFDTDGCVENDSCISFSNVSEVLIKQMQKMLLRYGIVSRIRNKPASSMKIYDKEYDTLPGFELQIGQKKSILDFHFFIGFKVKRKQHALRDLVAKICSNIHYFSCNNCNYKIYRDLFSGRSEVQQEWGKKKLEIISYLGQKGESGSRKIKDKLGYEPKKKETRLNHHYELLNKRKIGELSKTEWYWGLNPIGEWIYQNLLIKNQDFREFYRLSKCPLCHKDFEWIIKKGWRSSDFDGDIFWDFIRTINEVKSEPYVYDVVLPKKPKNNHMFVANGFIVHNSMGVDLPAYRVILRDLKRFGQRGMQWIPVLEYEQMSGRCGRPSFDKHGEAICIAKSDDEKEKIWERYVDGEPEEIVSKLAVEPVLRIHVLSLVATEFCISKQDLYDFFEKTFYAFQYENSAELRIIIDRMVDKLQEWEFLKGHSESDFKTAAEIVVNDEKMEATLMGKRVSELYLDPYTANYINTCLRKAASGKPSEFVWLHMLSSCLEMRPLPRVKTSEFVSIQEAALPFLDELFDDEPSEFDYEYEYFMNAIKSALFFNEWIDEKDEEHLLEKFDIRPGEVHAKLAIADWLLYGSSELASLLNFKPLIKHLSRLRSRLKYGVKEELLTLLKLKNIGRVRARLLFKNGIKDLGDVKKVDVTKLVQLLGKKLAIDVKKQVGIDLIKAKVPERKRKGQINLKDF
ncbi:LAGLIDADG family homing endonuclease [Nanoarchaeota archaeon]